MNRHWLKGATLLLLAASFRADPAAAQRVSAAAASSVDGDGLIAACYVRRAGTIYLIGEEGTPETCTRADHVRFEWNEQWDVSAFQRRVAATCEAGSSIRSIHEDGSVECEPDDDSAAGYDFGSLQLRIQPCGAGSSIRAVHDDGRVECEVDDVAGTGGFQARVAEGCPDGSSMAAIGPDGTVTCRVDRGATTELVLDFPRFAREPGDDETDLGSTTDRVCFLSSVSLAELDSRGEIGDCHIVPSGGRWLLRARATGDDSRTSCSARCLSWSN